MCVCVCLFNALSKIRAKCDDDNNRRQRLKKIENPTNQIAKKADKRMYIHYNTSIHTAHTGTH